MVQEMSHQEAEGVDCAWIPQRLEVDAHRFEWSAIRKHAKRCSFKVERHSDGQAEIVAAFAVFRKLRSLHAGRTALRLDFFEVAPIVRTKGYGALGFAMVETFALAVGANTVVLGASDQPRERSPKAFYKALGGTVAKTRGWTAPRDLSPIRFDLVILTELKERIDAYRKR